MVRGKKMGLGEFLGDQTAAYIPEAALPSGPRIRYAHGVTRVGVIRERTGG